MFVSTDVHNASAGESAKEALAVDTATATSPTLAAGTATAASNPAMAASAQALGLEASANVDLSCQ